MNQWKEWHLLSHDDDILLTMLKLLRYMLDKEYDPEDYAMASFAFGDTPSELIDQFSEMYGVIKAELETRGYQVHQHLAVIPHTDIQRDTQ